MNGLSQINTRVKYKGYTAVQSGLNNHICIFNSDSCPVCHISQSKSLNDDALRKKIEVYLKLYKAMDKERIQKEVE